MNKKKALIYTRVSTDEQAKEGYSLAAQKKTCSELAKKLGYQIIDIFSDEGKSATVADRPQFQEMIDRCEEGNIDAVIIFHTDRFARNELDHAFYKDKLRQKGIKLLSVSQPMIDDSAEGKLLDGILANINAYYSRDLSRKTKKGLYRKFEEGGWPGKAYLGFNNIKDDDNRGIIVQDKIRAPLIKKVFKLYSTGNYSYLKLCKIMYKNGLTTKAGKMLSVSIMQSIISNPFYYGLMKLNGRENIGNHKPIIKKSLYDLCQYVAAKHRGFIIRERKHDFLLRGFVSCKKHSRRLVAEWHPIKSKKRNNKIAYYHCSNRGGCKSSWVEKGKLENSVANQFKKIKFKEEFIKTVTRKVKNIYKNTKTGVSEQKRAIFNQIKGLETKRNKLEDRLLDETITRDAFKRIHVKLQDEIDSLNGQIIDLEEKRKMDINLIDEVLALTRNVYQTYLDAPKPLKRHYLRFFFEKLIVDNKKLTYARLTPVYRVLTREQKVILSYSRLRGEDSDL